MDAGDRDPGPPSDLGERLRRQLNESGNLPSWYTIVSVAGEVIGYLRYLHIDRRAKSAELAVRIGREHWGNGYATEATSLFCEYLVGEFHPQRPCLEVLPSNRTAQRVYEKCGFARTGETRIDPDGTEWLVMIRDSSP